MSTDIRDALRRIEAYLLEVLDHVRAAPGGEWCDTSRAARILGIGRDRLRALCRDAEARRETTILDNVAFRKTGGGAQRPRFALFVGDCIRGAVGSRSA